MSLTKRTYKHGETVITAENMNAIQDEIIRVGTALDNGDFDGKDGKDGVTPNFTIGTVTTLSAGSNATASITGTAANPVLNLGIPKGKDGTNGTGGGGTGADGEDGGYYVPSVDSSGNLRWTASKTGMPSVQSSNIKGADGKTPVRGTDYWTSSDIAEIKSYVDDAILGGAW